MRHSGDLQFDSQQVCGELHQEAIASRAAVGANRLQRYAGVLIHHVQDIAQLVCDRFLSRTNDVIPIGMRGEPDNRRARVWFPVGCAEPGKSGHEVDAAVVRHCPRQPTGLRGGFKDAELILQPRNGSRRVVDDALEGLGWTALQDPGNRRDGTALGEAQLVPDVQ